MPYPDDYRASTAPDGWEPRTDRLADALGSGAIATNRRIADILTRCAAEIEAALPSDYVPCMTPGFDLRDLLPALRELVPLHDNPAQLAAVDAWAADRAREAA